MSGTKEQAFADHYAKMSEMLKGCWSFRGVKVGGDEIWAFSKSLENLEDTESLKKFLEGFKFVEFLPNFQIGLANGQKTSFAYNPLENVIDIDASFAKIQYFSRLEFKVESQWRENKQQRWLHFDLLGLETVGPIVRPIPVRLYFSQ